MKPRIILASTSPRRHGLLQQIGVEFEVIHSDFEEDMTQNLPPVALARKLAEEKAMDVAKKVGDGIVIGADTFLVAGNKKLGKPKDKHDAIRMLKAMSGKTIKVVSGLAIIDAKTGRKVVDSEVTKIKVRRMTNSEIKCYVDTKEALDKAGCIAIQGLGAIFISEIHGCSSNVIGLPLYNLYRNLRKFGVNIFEFEKWKS